MLVKINNIYLNDKKKSILKVSICNHQFNHSTILRVFAMGLLTAL